MSPILICVWRKSMNSVCCGAAGLRHAQCCLRHGGRSKCHGLCAQNGNSFATMSMPARAAGHGNTTPRQGSSSYPPDRDARATPGSGPGLDRLSPLMSAPPGFSVEVRQRFSAASVTLGLCRQKTSLHDVFIAVLRSI